MAVCRKLMHGLASTDSVHTSAQKKFRTASAQPVSGAELDLVHWNRATEQCHFSSDNLDNGATHHGSEAPPDATDAHGVPQWECVATHH